MPTKYCSYEKKMSVKCKFNIFIAAMLLVITSGYVFAQDKPVLADRHKNSGLTCEACHDTNPKQAVEGDKCLGCHENSAAVAKRTINLQPNPHSNHLLDIDCTKCHVGHKAQVNYCQNCHSEMVFEKKKNSSKQAGH